MRAVRRRLRRRPAARRRPRRGGPRVAASRDRSLRRRRPRHRCRRAGLARRTAAVRCRIHRHPRRGACQRPGADPKIEGVLMAAIGINGLTKVFPNGVVAIRDVHLDVADGEFLVLVGPSGCGKSTLLRMLAGLEDVSAGDLFIGGKDVTDAQPRERDVAMVFQSYALYPHMTVRKNISYPLKLAPMPTNKTHGGVTAGAQTLQLGAVLDRKPAQLSGGQRQRVAMGRAIVRKPAVFLM